MPVIRVALNPPYEIIIEPHVLDRLGKVIREAFPVDRAMLIVDANVTQSHGQRACRSLEAAGFRVAVSEVIADERHKTIEAVQRLYDAMLAARLDRTSPVIAVGGGITGDVAGFAAATFLRGLPLVQVPTTLLAMVDAAIGGKTGVNYPLPEGGVAKNMVGSFHQPRLVLADPRTLPTLDQRELRCGLAECIKHAVIADAGLFDFLVKNTQRVLALDMEVLTTLIERSAQIKASIVSEDEREAGRRALLNLGHTFAHAIETIESLRLKHGEAVAIGLCAAAHAAVRTDRLDDSDSSRIETLIDLVGLPRRISSPVAASTLIERMSRDKKVADGALRVVLPTSIGSAELAGDVSNKVLTAAWEHVGASSQ